MTKIEFLHHARTNFIDNRRQIVGPQRGDKMVKTRREEGDQIEVGLDDLLQLRALELYGDGAVIVLQTRKIDLGQRRRGDRSLIEFGEDIGGIAFQLLEQNRAHLGEGQGLHGILQLAQLEDEGRRHQVGPHAQKLARFHKRRSQLLGRQTNALDRAAALFGCGHKALPPAAGSPDLFNEIGEAVADEHGHDLLGPHGVGQQVERFQRNNRHGGRRDEKAKIVRRRSRVRRAPVRVFSRGLQEPRCALCA